MQLTFLTIVGLQLATFVAADFQPKQKVVVIQSVEIKTTTGSMLPLPLGSPLTVEAVEGDRLKVSNGRIGWIAPSQVIAQDKADAHFSELIEKNPKDATAWGARGIVRFNQGKHDLATPDLDQSLSLAPNSYVLTIRGFSWKRKGDKDKAMADFNEAIKLNPKEALAWRVRGATWASKANYAQALAEYSESIRLDPENPDSLHHRVIMLSGCMDDKIRNGKQAVEDATKACEISGWKNPLYLSGLGIAYSEAGDFDAAVKWYSKSIDLSSDELKKILQPRLEQFKMHKPFRTEWK